MPKKYTFCSYWQTWSRVLQVTNNKGYSTYIEVNLQPVNHHTGDQSLWDNKVAPIVIREHCTRRDKRDIETDNLPPEVEAQMFHHLGQLLVQRLLFEDFLPHIDMNLLRSHPSGGARLQDVKKK